MSAEDEMSAMIDFSVSEANNLSAMADFFIGKANDAISGKIDFKNVVSPKDVPEYYKKPKPKTAEDIIGLPLFNEVDITPLDKIPELNKIDIEFDGQRPKLDIPKFSFWVPEQLAVFSEVTPSVDGNIEIPPPPDLTKLFTPEKKPLTALNEVDINALKEGLMKDIEFLSMEKVLDSYNKKKIAEAEAKGESTEGIGSEDGSSTTFDDTLTAVSSMINSGLSDKFSEITALTKGVVDQLLATVTNTILERISNPLASSIKEALLDDYTIRNEIAESLSTNQRWSGWDLPKHTLAALLSTGHALYKEAQTQADSQITKESLVMAIDLTETAGDVAVMLYQAALQFKEKEVEAVLESYRFSVEYGKQVLASLLGVYELYVSRQEQIQAENELKIKVFSANLRVAEADYEVAKAKLEAAQSVQEMDGLGISELELTVKQKAGEVSRYETEVLAVSAELDAIGFTVELFSLQVKKFAAESALFEAETRMEISKVDSDSGKLEGELAKVKKYQAEVKGYAAEIDAKVQKYKAIATRNNAVIDKYKVESMATLGIPKQDAAKDKYELAKHKLNADNMISDAKLALTVAEADLAFYEEQQKGQMMEEKFNEERTVELRMGELERIKAVAEAYSKGGMLFGNMAEGAMQAANGVASAVFSESA